MVALQKTLFIIALFVLLTQTVRHVYVRWVEPTSSRLDKYEPPVKEDIKKAGSLDELVKQYEEARKKTPEAEGRLDRAIPVQQSETELLKTAIQGWEARTKEIFELRFFWVCGLVLLLSGLICYRQGYLWAGLTMITAGSAEMIWWTSPTLRWGAGSIEFEKLLTNKIVFSTISIIILLITGYLVERLSSLRVKGGIEI